MKRIVIDAGHGGADSGALSSDIIEKDLTLKISKYLKKRFDELGVESSLTRDDDITLNPSDRVNKALSFYGNGSDIIILSNHINAGGGDGAEVIYSIRNDDTLSKLITNELANAGQNIRKYYQRRLPSDPSKDYYYMLRNTPETESVIIEYGFLDGNGDDKYLLLNNYEDLAEGVVKAVTKYVGVPYYPVKDLYYTVIKGDTLYSIAKKFNISLDELKSINNLNSNLISVGDKLVVSIGDIDLDDNYYVVKKGDTLYKIARMYNISVNDLMGWNNLSGNNINVGDKLIIKKPDIDIASDVDTYVVKKGDTLYSIAKKYNTSVSDIKTLNNIDGDNLSIGLKLVVPKNVDYVIYSVEPNDTLYSISRKFNTTVSMLSDINNLSTSMLSVGQKLIIP